MKLILVSITLGFLLIISLTLIGISIAVALGVSNAKVGLTEDKALSFFSNFKSSYKSLVFYTINLSSLTYFSFYWPGIQNGCDCLGVQTVPPQYRNKVLEGLCTSQTFQCKNVQEFKQQDYIRMWKNMPMYRNSFKYTYLDYLNLTNDYGTDCIEGHICGVLDILGQVLCLPNNQLCPINKIVIQETKTPPTDGYRYVLLYSSNATSHHYVTRDALNQPVITEMNISEGLITTDPNVYCSGTKDIYPLSAKQTIDCTKEEAKKLIDPNYRLIDTVDKETFFKYIGISIWNRLKQLPGLPKDYLNTPIGLYGRNVVRGAISKKCLTDKGVSLEFIQSETIRSVVENTKSKIGTSKWIIMSIVVHCIIILIEIKVYSTLVKEITAPNFILALGIFILTHSFSGLIFYLVETKLNSASSSDFNQIKDVVSCFSDEMKVGFDEIIAPFDAFPSLLSPIVTKCFLGIYVCGGGLGALVIGALVYGVIKVINKFCKAKEVDDFEYDVLLASQKREKEARKKIQDEEKKKLKEQERMRKESIKEEKRRKIEDQKDAKKQLAIKEKEFKDKLANQEKEFKLMLVKKEDEYKKMMKAKEEKTLKFKKYEIKNITAPIISLNPDNNENDYPEKNDNAIKPLFSTPILYVNPDNNENDYPEKNDNNIKPSNPKDEDAPLPRTNTKK